MNLSTIVGFSDGAHGIEPWVVDINNSAAKMTMDINKRESSSKPSHLTIANDWLYFVADDGIHGKKLWMNDGTSDNSIMVDDGIPAGIKSDIGDVLVLDNKVFFIVYAHLNSYRFYGKIYMTDIGSTSVTELDDGFHFLSFNDKIFYVTKDSIKVFDPQNNTKETVVSGGNALYSLVGHIDNALLFMKGKQDSNGRWHNNLYKNENNTITLLREDVDISSKRMIVDKKLFIVEHGKELWCYDHTKKSITKLHDFSKQIVQPFRKELAAFDGKLYFIGNDNEHGDALWVSDGTADGTLFLKDLNIHNLGAGLRYPHVANNKLYFQSGREPWVTDGTKEGTLLLELNGVYGSNPEHFTAYKNKVYFKANTSNSDDLYVTDGTKDGTERITMHERKEEFLIDNLIVFKNFLFFGGGSKQHGEELWKSNGTKEGTELLSNINKTTKASVYSKTKFIKMGKYYYFIANDGNRYGGFNDMLWKTDGTTTGTTIVKKPENNQELSPRYLTLVGDKLFFAAGTSSFSDVELWVSDGTEEGTHMVKDIMPNDRLYKSGSYPTSLIDANGTLVFIAKDKEHGYQIWKSDGTENGTVMISNFNDPNYIGRFRTHLVYLKGAIYFNAKGAKSGEEFYKLDIATGATAPVKKGLSGIEEMVLLGNTIYFKAYSNDVSTKEIWLSDGTEKGTKLLKKIQSGPAYNTIHNLTVAEDKLYFLASDGQHGVELWVSDGTANGTKMVKDITPGDYTSHTEINQMTAVGDRLYFTAYDNEHGEELWVSNGEEGGTHLVKDIVPGIMKSAVKICHGISGKLLFSAYDENGNHLWITDGTEEGTKIIEPSK